MATDVFSGPLGHQRLAGAASGIALSTTAVFTGLIKGTGHIRLIPRNFSTAVVIRYIPCPYLVVLKADSADDLLTPPVDYSEAAQDGNAGEPRVVLNDLAAGRFLYIGSAVPFRGAHCDVRAVNGTTDTAITVRYWNGSSWVDTGDTDGTIDGVSLAQDGPITWTMPGAGAWKSASLAEISQALGNRIAAKFAWRNERLYWTRWQWSHVLDASVDLDHILGINESTAYAETIVASDGGIVEMRVHHGFGSAGIGGFEMKTNAGTANCLMVCSALSGYFSIGEVR